MRFYLTFFLFTAFLFSGLHAQDFDRDKISTRLLEAIDAEARSSSDLDIYIVLKDQIAIDALVDSFDRAGTPVKERAVFINKELRRIAARSQGAVVAKLQGLGIPDITPVWVVNALFFKAKPTQVKAITLWDEIKFLDLDTELQIDEPTERSGESRPRGIAGTRELGLEVIQAPKMWARGYTGYGRKAFIMDTGVDPDHPAIMRNYAGHIAPEDQVWFGFRDRFNRPYDCQNHGTHCTGTVLGIDRERRDTIGVAYNAMWMGAPILLVCGGNTAIRMAGFQWSIDPDDNPETTDDMPDVINNSWTDTMVEDCYEVYEQLLTTVEAAGIAVVFAAGNDGPGASTISQPKNINKGLVNTFAVGALDARNLNITNFSSRGPSRCGGEGSLLIKPEVSAPGFAVRSSIPGNAYANFNGTSMAAPHAAGAILLLKEAFPYLSGMEVKLALYFSATDLGEPGEDNVFGMGLINVDAAYEYLIQEGHVPVSPHASVDLSLGHFDMFPSYCQGGMMVALHYVNEGAQALNGINIEIFENDRASEAMFNFNRDLSIAAGESVRDTIFIPLSGNGLFNMMLKAQPMQVVDEKPLNNSIRLFFNFHQTPDWDLQLNEEALREAHCGGTTLILENIADEGILQWYDAGSANLLHLGNQYAIDLPEADTTLDFLLGMQIEELLFDPTRALAQSVMNLDSASGFVLHTYQPVQLKSLRFNIKERGFVTLNIRSESGTSFFSSLRIYNEGEHIVPINATLPANQIIRISLTSNRAVETFVFEPREENAYFHALNSILLGEAVEEWISPIYGLELSYDVPCDLKPFQLHVRQVDIKPEAFFTFVPDDIALSVLQEISFLNDSKDADLFHWSFGDGNRSTEEFPVYGYATSGTYQVVLTAEDGQGCVDMYATEIVISEDNTTNTTERDAKLGQIYLFPNPTSTELNIVFEGEMSPIKKMSLIQLDGRTIQLNPMETGLDHIRIDLGNLSIAPGIYFLQIETENQALFTGKFVKQ